MPLILLNMLGLFSPKTWIIIGGLAVLGAGALYERHALIKQGHDEAIADINAANEKAQRNADQGSKDVASCYDAGGTWNRVTGVCDNATGK